MLSAYLEGFEQVERKLRVSDSTLLQSVETNFMRLRELAQNNKAQSPEFIKRLAKLEKDLHTSSELLSGKKIIRSSSPMSDLVASAIIILREGLEAFLIIIALLSLVKNLGLSKARKWIHTA